jgi:hypothetical protein
VRLSPDERERVFLAVADERRSIAELIDGLDPQQLAMESLCAGWDVKTVAAHLISDFADGFWGFLASGIRHGNINRGIDALARRRARAPAAEIAETLRREADHRLSPPVTGPLSGLTDVLVHGADMRIPLGISHRSILGGWPALSTSLRARHSLASFRIGFSAASRFKMRTPGKSGATANTSGDRAQC